MDDELLILYGWQPTATLDTSLVELYVDQDFFSESRSTRRPEYPAHLLRDAWSQPLDLIPVEVLFTSGFFDEAPRPQQARFRARDLQYDRPFTQKLFTYPTPTTIGSGPPYLGGMAFTRIRWISAQGLRIDFSSSWGTTYLHQLYIGRTLVGVTDDVSDRKLIAQWKAEAVPEVLTLLAVDPAERRTDYGERLPRRAYNRVKLVFDGQDEPNCRAYEVSAGTEPGGAVDTTNVIGRALHDRGREYTLFTDPLTECGSWNLQLAARDNALPDGNLGPAAAFTAEIITQPTDLPLSAAGNRFDLAIAGGLLTVTI